MSRPLRSAVVFALLAAACRDEPSPPRAPAHVAAPVRPAKPAPPPAADLDALVAELDDPGRDAWQHPDEVVGLLDLRPGHVVADLGAGTGYFLPHLSPAVGERGRVIALEPDDRLVDILTSRVQADALDNVDVRRIPFDDPQLDRQVDRVLVVDAWRYIEDREQYAGKLASALAPGGAVLIIDFDPGSARAPDGAFPLTADQAIAELSHAGLVAARVDEQLPDQFAVIGRRPEPS